jgi:hypothetical protein
MGMTYIRNITESGHANSHQYVVNLYKVTRMGLYRTIFFGFFFLPFIVKAQMGIADSAVVEDRSFLEYNGLKYQCIANDTLHHGAGDSLIAHWKDSSTKIALVHKYVELMSWLNCAVQSDTRTIVVNIPSADLFVFQAG